MTPASDVSLNNYLAAGCHTFYVVVFGSDRVLGVSFCFIRRWPGDLGLTETHLRRSPGGRLRRGLPDGEWSSR